MRIFLLLALLAAPALAAFEDLGAGARAPGMGDAFTAVADDVYAMHYNPAGLGALERPELGLTYARLYAGLADGSNLGQTSLAFAQPLNAGRWGALGAAWQELRLDAAYAERSVALSYGRAAWRSPRWGALYLGGQVRSLSRGFQPGPEADNAFDHGAAVGAPDPALQGSRRRSAIAADAGLLLRAPKRYALGLSVSQLNEPDIGFAGPEKLPLRARAALSYKSLWMVLAAEARHERAANGRATRQFVLAGERSFPSLDLGELGVRASIGVGEVDFREATVGLSYAINKIRADYAFLMPIAGVAGTVGVHRVGLSFLFGALSAEEQYARELLGEVEARRHRRAEAPGLAPERPEVPPSLESPRVEAVRAHIERGEFLAAQRALEAALQGARSAPTLEHLQRRLRLVAAAYPDVLEPREPWRRTLRDGCRDLLFDHDRKAMLRLAYAASLAPADERLGRLLADVEAETGLRAEKPAKGFDLLQTKHQRSSQAFARRDYQTAFEEARDAQELAPDDPKALKRLGSALFMLSHHFEAIAAWESALELERSPVERANLQGYIERSKKALEAGAKPEPAKPRAAAAAAPQPRAPALDPRAVERLYQQGMERYARGELDQAAAAFERILASEPRNAPALKALERIRRSRR
ncbi:MAG: hypothetical protein HY554_01585 [Elusimicrobia bacterium]|nr:hypothetical protein [Elusimicrobiota bacterium]